MLNIQKKNVPMPANHEIRVRTLSGNFPYNSYLVKYDTEAGKTIGVIGRIVRGGKEIAEFSKSEYPNEDFGTYGHLTKEGILFVYKPVYLSRKDRLLARMNAPRAPFYPRLLE